MAHQKNIAKSPAERSHLRVLPSAPEQPAAPVWLDLANETLKRDHTPLELTPKAFAVLRYLHEHPQRLVTKHELFAAVWRGTYVTDGVLKNCISEIRQALHDSATAPQYIETVHRRGYRLLRPLRTTFPLEASPQLSVISSSQPPTGQTPNSELRTFQPLPPTPQPLAGERRQLTVLSCNLIGSTALSVQLDPEDYSELIQKYTALCHAVVQRYEGYIAQHLADGILVYFGYPSAHDDAARRAVQTGLEIVAALQRHPILLPSRESIALHVRVGIHTGPVVMADIGADGRTERVALGETPNLAARIQGHAHPDEVVISAATYRLVAGFFACEDRGQPELKGVTSPLTLYRIIKESASQSRFDVAIQTGLTPLVGREDDVALLRRRWAHVTEGEGHVVLLSGEAGIGKSRLAQVLKEQVASDMVGQVEYRCSPSSQNSAFYPVIDHLQRLLQFTRDDAPEEKVRKLQTVVEEGALQAMPRRAEVVALFAALLALPLPPQYPPLTLTPQRQKQKILEALVTWLVKEAERQPVLVVVEDVHWVDPSTLEFLSLLLEQAPTTRILLLLTFRPEFTPPWTMFSHITRLTLSRLARRQVEEMVEKITGGKSLPTEVIQQLITKTDGVPLFIEELTKMVVESGLVRATEDHYKLTGPLLPLAIPTTLQDSLIARLDRLATVKEVAQLGATLGREFSYELIRAVAALSEPALRAALAKLVDAEILYQRGSGEHARYVFKHALIQDTAYQSLLKRTRQRYHRQIARMLEERFPETTAMQPELLAHHYTEADLTAQAIPYWLRAGQQATSRSANSEASNHLKKGIALLTALPPTPELIQQELSLQMTLGSVVMLAQGCSPEAGQAYDRARELCQQSGATAQLSPVLHGLWGFYNVRGEYRTSYALAEQLLSLAESQPDDTPGLIAAHFAMGNSAFLLGELTVSRAHWGQSVALYNLQEHRSLASEYGLDLGVTSRSGTALTLWQLGYPDQALKSMQAAVSLAQEVAHPSSVAYALMCAAWSHLLRREEQQAQEQAEAAMALSTEHGIPLFFAMSTIYRGWALAQHGQGVEGLTHVRQGLATFRAMGSEMFAPFYLTLLAEASATVGQVEEGLICVAEALATAKKTEEGYWEAERYRLAGELSLQQFNVQGSKFKVEESPESEVRSPKSPNPKSQILNPHSEAEACFLKAIEIARKQQAKSLELRAVMSLVRLRQQHASEEGSHTTQQESCVRLAEAHRMLSDVYNWFTEGFDTKDVQEAKALLASLAQ